MSSIAANSIIDILRRAATASSPEEVLALIIEGPHLELDHDAERVLSVAVAISATRTAIRHGTGIRTSLTKRELEALQMMAAGLTDAEIGERMKISEHGVSKHLRQARMKLRASSRVQAVADAVRRGIIK